MTDGKRPIILNAFTVLGPAQNGNGLWRHPEDERYRFNEVQWWIEYAQRMEDAGFTALMFADAFGTGDVTEKMNRLQIQEGVYFPRSDPFAYVPAMAAHTTRLGFIATASTTFESPYSVARRFTALDHLSGGRIAWNVVTSFLPAMAKAFGIGEMPGHTARYGRADEFLRASYRLWEHSWEDGAERQKGPDFRFDPDKIHPVHHHGEYFDIDGRYSIPPSPQRTPVLFQAGNSEEGQDFSARHAEVVLVGNSPEFTKNHIKRVREKAEAAGRDPEHIRFVAPAIIVADESDAAAAARLEDYSRYWSIDAGLASTAYYTGHDLTLLDPEAPFLDASTERHRAAAEGLRANVSKKVKDVIAQQTAFPGRSLLISGGPERVADQLEFWVDEVGVDGVNLMEYVSPSDIKNFIAYVVPELRRRGRLPEPEDGLTLRERLIPGGTGRLAADHPGRHVGLEGE